MFGECFGGWLIFHLWSWLLLCCVVLSVLFEFYFVSKIIGVGFSFIEVLLKLLAIVVPLLISVAYFTLAERKLMGGMHRRRGPNVVGFVGLLQPLADGLKLFVKESIIPSNSNYVLFILSPMVT